MSHVEQRPVSSAPPRRKRWLLWNGAGLVIALIAITGALWFWVNSSEFENLVRRRVITQLETGTGGRVEIRSFHWRLMNLEAEASGVVIHGLEDPGEAPWAQVERLRTRISILGLFSPHVELRDLEVLKPQFHLIVYRNQTTNQPHPRNPQKSGKSAIDTLFDLKAGHIAIEQGVFEYDVRAAAFDSLARYLPLDFEASDASLILQYVPASGGNAESYHLEAGVRDLNLARGGNSPSASKLHAYMQASLDLSRNGAVLRSLRVTANSRGTKERVLDVSGTLSDFAHPRWQAKISGEFDMRLLDPILGYPFAPDGLARMNLTAAGQMGNFSIDGPVHVDNGAFVAPGINARNLQVDTLAHTDPTLMHFAAVKVRFAQGGQVDGDLQLDHWAPHPPDHAIVEAAPAAANPSSASRPRHFWNRRKNPAPPSPPPIARDVLVKQPEQVITVKGKITSTFDNVALDTILDIVGQKPFDRLGVDTLLNGPATADWVNGDVKTLAVGTTLALSPSTQRVPGESPGTGIIDATYTQRDGSVDLRRLDLSLPASQIQAHGRLGAFPLTSQPP